MFWITRSVRYSFVTFRWISFDIGRQFIEIIEEMLPQLSTVHYELLL